MSTKTETNGNGHTTHGHSTKDTTPPASAKVTKVAVTPPAPAASSPAPAPPAPGLTAADIDEMLTQLDAMAALFGADATPLTIEERRKLLKIRPGGETYASGVMKIADRYHLAIPGVSSADVEADILLVQNLSELVTRFTSMLGLASDVSASAESRLWRAATTTYTTLTRLVAQYPSLQRELTPMASFLATKYKDAPTSLRKQERGALTKTRKARKEKEAAAAQTGSSAPGAATPTEAITSAAPVVAPATPAAVAETAPQVSAVAKTPAASS